MVLGVSVRKYENDEYGIKFRYLEYFKDFDLIFLYPGSDNLYKLCDGFVVIGGEDINPLLYNEENTASKDIDDLLDSSDYHIIDYAVKNQMPLFAICRGMQMTNIYFGGSLYQDIKNHQDGIRHKMFLQTNDDLPKIVDINSYHHQAIKELGKGLEVIYKSEDGIVEAIRHQSLPIIGLQYHPEMPSDKDSEYSLHLINWLKEKIQK